MIDESLFNRMAEALRAVADCKELPAETKKGIDLIVSDLPPPPDPDFAEAQTLIDNIRRAGNFSQFDLVFAGIKRGKALAS